MSQQLNGHSVCRRCATELLAGAAPLIRARHSLPVSVSVRSHSLTTLDGGAVWRRLSMDGSSVHAAAVADWPARVSLLHFR